MENDLRNNLNRMMIGDYDHVFSRLKRSRRYKEYQKRNDEIIRMFSFKSVDTPEGKMFYYTAGDGELTGLYLHELRKEYADVIIERREQVLSIMN